MALSRPIYTKLWADKSFRFLSEIDKLVFIYLQTNERFEQLAIYNIPIEYIAFEIGIAEDKVRESMNRLENDYGLIKYSNETEEVAILKYIERGLIGKDGAVMRKCYMNIDSKVKDKNLLLEMYRVSNKIVVESHTNKDMFLFALQQMKETLIRCELWQEEIPPYQDFEIEYTEEMLKNDILIDIFRFESSLSKRKNEIIDLRLEMTGKRNEVNMNYSLDFLTDYAEQLSKLVDKDDHYNSNYQ